MVVVWRPTLATCLATLVVAAPAAGAAPVASHIPTNVCVTGGGNAWALFGEARSSGSKLVRISVSVDCFFEAFGEPADPPERWRQLQEVTGLARQRGLRVVGVLMSTPKHISSCEGDPDYKRPHRCPPRDLARFAEMAGEIAYRTRGAVSHWEIWNEPDLPGSFEGSPEDYARMLAAAHDGIKARVPEAKIVLGGLSRPRPSWMARVFATPVVAAATKFDLASVHLRGRLSTLTGALASWRRFLASHGFRGPLWVTEHGYPGDPGFQYDSRFARGVDDQARYLARSVVALADAGASRVFVTLTDSAENPPSAFSSEGITEIFYTIFREEPVHRRRPALYALRRLARYWPRISALSRRHRQLVAQGNMHKATLLYRRIVGPYR